MASNDRCEVCGISSGAFSRCPMHSEEIATIRAALQAAEKEAFVQREAAACLGRQYCDRTAQVDMLRTRVAALEEGLKDAASVIDQLNANLQGNDEPGVRDPLSYAIVMAALDRLHTLLRGDGEKPRALACPGCDAEAEGEPFDRAKHTCGLPNAPKPQCVCDVAHGHFDDCQLADHDDNVALEKATCGTCGGSGWVREYLDSAMASTSSPCPDCAADEKKTER